MVNAQFKEKQFKQFIGCKTWFLNQGKGIGSRYLRKKIVWSPQLDFWLQGGCYKDFAAYVGPDGLLAEVFWGFPQL